MIIFFVSLNHSFPRLLTLAYVIVNLELPQWFNVPLFSGTGCRVHPCEGTWGSAAFQTARRFGALTCLYVKLHNNNK